MWVDHVLKCPDEGEVLQLVRVSEAGEVTLVGYLADEDFYALREPIQKAIAHDDAHGGPSMDQYIARNRLLDWLDDHFPTD